MKKRTKYTLPTQMWSCLPTKTLLPPCPSCLAAVPAERWTCLVCGSTRPVSAQSEMPTRQSGTLAVPMSQVTAWGNALWPLLMGLSKVQNAKILPHSFSVFSTFSAPPQPYFSVSPSCRFACFNFYFLQCCQWGWFPTISWSKTTHAHTRLQDG